MHSQNRPAPSRLQSTATAGVDSPRRDTMDPSGMSPISPQATRLKKPSILRRASTKRPMPHRGETFSVDDDPSEVEDERVPPTPREPTFPGISRQQSSVRQQSTVRRKTHLAVPQLTSIESRSDEEEETPKPTPAEEPVEADAQEAEVDPNEETAAEEDDDADDDGDYSDAESFTLRDRQLAINETHPFGIRIWKPALYKKNRSVEKNAEDDIHSGPSTIVSPWLWTFNVLWTVFFGWWLAAAAAVGALVCYLCSAAPSAPKYGRVFWGLSHYLFWPFGKFVKLEQDENYAEEDEGEGRSISEFERWQGGDLEYGRLMFGPTITHTGSLVGRRRESIDSASEHDSLLGRSGRSTSQQRAETDLTNKSKRRLFGRGHWTLGRVIFFVFFYFNLAPLMLLVSLLCWLMVFWIPMGRVLHVLFHQLRKRPLALSFHRDASNARGSTRPSSVIICTYRAVGSRYWKYTIDGTNIFLINFLAVVAFVIFDYFVLRKALSIDSFITSPALLFTLGLISVIPLAYFIGQSVASISAQSTMGMGAAINAFFSTVVEVYLYCIALNDGKGKLVEGSIIGSIFAGILLLPGLSMCFGAIKRKTQRFNVRSASATSTMLLFATIAAFGPTLFYKIYGSHELICKTCSDVMDEPRDCRQCYFRQVPAINDEFFVDAVRPFCWFAAVLLFSSYIIGLLFTLRTHAATIWAIDVDEKKPLIPPTAGVSPFDTRRVSAVTVPKHVPNGSYLPRSNVRDSQMYKRILGQALEQSGLPAQSDVRSERSVSKPDSAVSMSGPDSSVEVADYINRGELPHLVPPKNSHGGEHVSSPGSIQHRHMMPGLSEEDNDNLVRRMAEMASTAATVAARDATSNPRSVSQHQATQSHSKDKVAKAPTLQRVGTFDAAPLQPHEQQAEGGGHDAPNWSRMKSSVILLTATVAYAIVAEVLVDTVDVVLEGTDVDEKFLGITLFALVPNTTEFLNAISFAMNGNIALSMEIGSAYALQVCLLQIPALVLFSAVTGRWIEPGNLIDHTFQLIFPQWDMVTVILCVFLLTYMYNEGKSNYFKGSILVLTYLVVLMGFYFSGYTSLDTMGADPWDTLALNSGLARQYNTGHGSMMSTKKLEL